MFEIGNVIAAFSEEQVQRLTKLSKGRLRYWDNTGFFSPSYVEENRRLPFARFYSFKDVVALRTLEMLRVQNQVPLQHLRKVAETLAHLRDDLWTNTILWVLNKKVIFQEPGSRKPREVVSGQYVMGLPLRRVLTDTKKDVAAMQRRSNGDIGRVVKMRGINRNAPSIAGTRIRADSICRLAEDGFTIRQILAEYPDLKEADVHAVLHGNQAAA